MEALQTYLDACHRESVQKSLAAYEEIMAASRSRHFAPPEFNATILPVIEPLGLRSLVLSGVPIRPALFQQLLAALGGPNSNLELLDVEGVGMRFSSLDLSGLSVKRLNISNNTIDGPISLPKGLESLEIRKTGVTSIALAGALRAGLRLLDCSENSLRADFQALALKMAQIGLKSAVFRACGLNSRCVGVLKQRTWVLLDIQGNSCVSERELQDLQAGNISMLTAIL